MNFKILTFLFFILSSQLHGQLFVNASATGANNGSSWANAYTNLATAIASAPQNSQIWIAAGTYKPGNSRSDYFSFNFGVELYGGFAGNETSLSQRDFDNNLTILSGDIAGNDIPGNVTSNRTDNSMHIVYLPSAISGAVTFDGFTFQGGHTVDGSGSGNDRRGGAILSYSTINVRNCNFKDNYGHYGAAIYPRSDNANNTEIKNCTFTNNSSNYGSAIFMSMNTASAIIDNCTFDGNATYVFGTANGGGTVASTTTSYNMTNCTFTNNSSYFGGAIYNYSQSGGAPLSRVVNCDFSNNTATFGGAVQAFDIGISIEFDNCTFTNNSATTRGGAIAADNSPVITVKNSTFQGNSAGQGCAIGVVTVPSLTIENSIFLNHTVNTQGVSYGGAVLAADIPQVSVTGSTFDGNTAYYGGGLHVETNTPGTSVFVSKSKFLNNTSTFLGGGISVTNVDIEIEDCLIADNTAAGTGGGVALTTTGTGGTALILNSTIANNQAQGAGGISQVINNGGTLDMVLRNTILKNITSNYQNNSQGFTPTVTTGGGNISSDATLVNDLNGTNDKNNTDPSFVSPGTGDYHLLAGSLAIDNGVGTVSPTDLDGEQRLGAPDSGSFEYLGASNNSNILEESLTYQVFPNPAIDVLNFEVTNDWRGTIGASIIDAKGATVYSVTMDKVGDNLQESIDVSQLGSGTYQLLLSRGSTYQVKSFVINL